MNRTTPAKARFENLSEGSATLPDMTKATHLHLVEPVPTWRDLTDQLAQDEVVELERWEREGDAPIKLRAVAERYAQRKALAREYANVPLPAGATAAYDWEPDNDDEPPTRYFSGTDRGDGPMVVGIAGFQWPDGRAKRHICVTVNDIDVLTDMTSADVRKCAADLLAAADELDAINGAVK